MSTHLLEGVRALRTQLILEHSQAPGLFREMAQVEKLLAETYRSRVLYELLQNSDDAGSTSVRIELSGLDLSWSNDGRPFDLADIEALCRSASSTKHSGSGLIGYRGIGFKSVAAVASHVEVSSAGVTLHFNRTLAAGALNINTASTPLLRVPAIVEPSKDRIGARFKLKMFENALDQLVLDPIAILFLRNLVSIEIVRNGKSENIRCNRQTDHVHLDVDGRQARFHRLVNGDIEILIPADPQAETLTGGRGRLCCFLPLDDEISLPVIASGPVLTDPSRTHATLTDPVTQRVLATIGGMIGRLLINVSNEASKRLWELILRGEDLRSVVLQGNGSIGAHVLNATCVALRGTTWPFSFSEVALEEIDVQRVFPTGAPAALYSESLASSARSLRTVFGIPTLRAGDLANIPNVSELTEATRARLSRRLIESARVEGRSLTPSEQAIVGKFASSVYDQQSHSERLTSSSSLDAEESSRTRIESFSGIIARWRVAEIAVMDYLNQNGWKLTDVSRQTSDTTSTG